MMTEVMTGVFLMLASFTCGACLGIHLPRARENGGDPAPTARRAAGPSPIVSPAPCQTNTQPPAEEARRLAFETMMGYGAEDAYGQNKGAER